MRRCAATIAIALAVSGCGRLAELDAVRRNVRTPDASAGPTAPKPSATTLGVIQDIPVETFVVAGGTIPQRLRATELKLQLRSNIDGATFECRQDVDAVFKKCPEGDAFAFRSLVHGQGYTLAVRAKSPDGRLDKTPYTVSFVVDRVAGQEPFTAASTSTQGLVAPSALPRQIETTSTAVSDQTRELQIGSYYSVVVPYSMSVASFATTKTPTGRMRLLYLDAAGSGSVFSGQGCNREFETLIPATDALRYCEATPNHEQYAAAYARPLPMNHLELVSSMAGRPVEKLLVSGFDSEIDPFESGLGIETLCATAQAQGTSTVPVLRRFAELQPDREQFRWCQVRGGDGQWWWLGYFGARLGRATTSPRLKVVYSASAARGIVSPQQFLERASTLLSNVIVPLGPAN
jgi:hypothetical protein